MGSNDRSLINVQVGAQGDNFLPAAPNDNRNGEWNLSGAVQAPSSVNYILVYFHALRRHWVIATALGVLCAALAGPATWFSIGSWYTASSILRVAMQEKPIISPDDVGMIDRDRFDIYKNTQQQLLLNRFVLMTALRKQDVTKLPVIQEIQSKGEDPVTWLQSKLSVNFPGRAEILEVSLSRYDPDEATALVKAVVDAYMSEVVYVERDQKRLRLSELERAFVEKETDIRNKREELKKVAESLGTSDTETLSVKQKLVLEELTVYRQEMSRSQFESRRLMSELAGQQAVLQSLDTLEGLDAEVEKLVQNDPIARSLFVELGWKKIDQQYTEGAIATGSKSHYASRYQQDLKIMQDQYDSRRAELTDLVRQEKRTIVQRELQRLETSLAVMREQERNAQKEIEAKAREAIKIGTSSVDIEMMRSDIRNIDMVLGQISSEREKLKVESRQNARVSLILPAERPDMPSNFTIRVALSLLTSLLGLCLPAIVVALLDVPIKRINNSEDVSKGLSLPVIGSVPLIPSRVIRQLGSPSRRNQVWQLRLTESVDGITARVLRKAETEQCRVIMVSSAEGGEGKTTLSTQLALSLSRTGRKTVLVDFDLRRPAFDEVFGLPLEPGVCEALRDRGLAGAVVHQVNGGNLAVVTAGRWDRNTLASLSNGAAAAMFGKLREEYEFVVVDTSPLLPVADARFVSQHVDSVVLSVFRDKSEAPKIQAACEILSAFGVQTIEAVVTGPARGMRHDHKGYESTIPA